jgi:phosphoheptose isomerase
MNTSRIKEILSESAKIKKLLGEECAGAILKAGNAIAESLSRGRKILLFGNGGSAADAQHICAELVVRFGFDRNPLPAIALTTNSSIMTAASNDYGFEQVFARQIRALGRQGDIAVAISTSGQSPNVLEGVRASKATGLITIGLTGSDGGLLAQMVEIPVTVPSNNTARIQECHITIGHILCEAAESYIYPNGRAKDTEGKPSEQQYVATLSKVVDWDTLLSLRKEWRDEGKIIVWTNGCFDLLHAGHVRSLQECKELGDVLVVGVNSDDSVWELKGSGRPILPASERVELLAAFEFVDFVVVFEEKTPEIAIERLRPDIHCKGAEYAPPDGKPIPEAAMVERYGGKIRFIPMVPFTSTSEIIKRILEAKPDESST